MQGHFRPPVLLLCGFVTRLVHVRHGLHVSLAVYARNCCVLPRSFMLFRITDINVVTEQFLSSCFIISMRFKTKTG